MQQFVVPQFIDVEDKIIGPITVRQFLIMLAGGIAIFISYQFADFALFVLLTAFFGGLTIIFAFAKINGQTFHYFLLNVVQSVKKPTQRTWQKGYTDNELKQVLQIQKVEEVEDSGPQKKARRSHIQQLSLVVNTGGYYQEGVDTNQHGGEQL